MELIIIFDTETTDKPNWKEPSGGENQPHLVSLAAHLVNPDDQKIIQTMDVIIKPDGWETSAEALAVHGITTEHAMDVGIPEKLALEMFLALWNNRKRIAYNTTFDNRIIRIATKRFCEDPVIEAWKTGEYECAMQAARKIMPMSKPPKLEEAYLHFTGKKLQGAHTALADTNACMEVYFAVKSAEKTAL